MIPRYPFCSQVDGVVPQALTVNLRIVYQAAAQESPAADYFFRTMLFLVKVDRSRTKVDRSRIKVTFAGKQTTLVLTSQLLETIDFWQGRPGRQRQRARARRLAVCFEQCPSLPPANKHRLVNSIRLFSRLPQLTNQAVMVGYSARFLVLSTSGLATVMVLPAPGLATVMVLGLQGLGNCPRKVDIRLPGKGNAISRGARPVYSF